MDVHIESELHNAIFHDPSFVQRFLSGATDKLQQIEQRCRASNQHYDRARQWPIPEHVSSENDLYDPILNILNIIKHAVDHVHSPPPSPITGTPNEPPQLFIDSHKSAIPSDLADTNQIKPDLVLFQDSHRHWENVRIPVEVKTSPGLHKAGMKQLSRYARATFAHQLHRRHLYGLLVCKTEATFVRYDRAGILYSKRMDIVKDGEAFTRAFASLLMLDRIDEGYDPAFTFERDDAGRLVYYINLPESAFAKTSNKSTRTGRNGHTRRFKVMEILCHRQSICGRATIVLRIREELDIEGQQPEEYALKMIWRDPERGSEGEILGKVYVPTQGNEEPHIVHVDTTKCRPTSHIRPLRVYSYILVESIGIPLWQAESPRRLLTAVLDAILGYWGAFNLGIMHRDISDGNVLMLDTDQTFSSKEWLDSRPKDSRIQDPVLVESEAILRSILEEIKHRDPTGILSDFDLYAMHSSVLEHTTTASDNLGTIEPVPTRPSRRRLEEETTSENRPKRRKTSKHTAVLIPPTSNPGRQQNKERPQARSQREKQRLIDFRTGTPAFMSIRVLTVNPGTRYHHHFFDDLESFFWLMLWSVAAHLDEGQECPTIKAQNLLDKLNQDNMEIMSDCKMSILTWVQNPDFADENFDAYANDWASDPMLFKAITEMGQGDPVADAVIFGSLLHKPRKVMTPPPLRLRGGDDGDRGPGEGGVDEDWGGMDWAGNRNYGGDGPDNPDDQDPEEGVEAEHPEIQVPPDEPREAPEDPGDEGAGAEIPALNEYPVLRNIYLRVWVQYAFAGATQSSIESMLKSHKFSLLASSIFGGFPPELIVQIQNMPTTLRSLERRLGLDFSDLLIIYALCPDPNCGKRYTMEELNELPSPRCTRHVAGLQCHGIMYEERTLADNTRKRIPMKTLPYNPVPAALGRLFSRVGMLDLAQIGKQDEADAPADPQTWFDQVGPDDPFGSMKKTWWWPTQLVGLQRELVNGEYVDVPTGNAPLFLTHLPVGFSLGVNMDGFGATRGKFSRHGGYSVNGCYIVVNDLPFYQRTLIENMILALVIPGPNEPKGYALEQMLEPLVTDLIALVNGVELPIYNSATGQIEQRLVYAKLSGVFVDWITRIKCTGHVGVTAEENHCLYCKIQQCLLSDERGYQSKNYELRDPHEHLQLKYEWLEAADEDHEEIRQRNGTIFTEFDRIPGFYSFDDCPIDAMHLFDLGMTRAIIRDIIYKPGMLRKRFRGERDRDIPEARFNAFFARTWFPWHCSRLPASIEKMTGCAKAEQWRSMVVVLPAALFEAWRVADTIPNANIQRGGANTVHSKTQTANAKLLLRRRVKLHELDDEAEGDNKVGYAPRMVGIHFLNGGSTNVDEQFEREFS
ncbi:transposase family Tnp2 protein, partial [Rhizoctonia solani AG-3 Rhs1AP]